MRVEPPFMADIAEVPFFPRQLEAMLSCVIHGLFVRGLMTAHALTGGHRAVNITLLGEIAVTVKTRFLRRSGRTGGATWQPHQEGKGKSPKNPSCQIFPHRY